MFQRIILSELKEWKNRDNRKPMILRGARQVGKTTAVELFSKNFRQYIYLNLEKKQDRELFEFSDNVSKVIDAICFSRQITRTPDTLLFIDEIQNSPQAVAMMRYFYEEIKDWFVIGAGSLLESMIGNNQISFPVGRVEYLFMHPLTFTEFLSASGESYALNALQNIPIEPYVYSKLYELFNQYVLLGGMPEIISKYVENRDIVMLSPVYNNLLTSYLDDVSKYASNQTMNKIIRHAIQNAPLEAGKRITFHGFGNSNYRSREMGEALRTLEQAMLIQLIYPVTTLQLPLIPDMKKSPKLQFLDTGLINYFAGLQGYFYKGSDLHSFYNGLIAEHITAQQLHALDSYRMNRISFWVRESKSSNAEVDFVLQYKNLVIPVEVKSGKDGRLKSLHQFINGAPHGYAVRLYAGKLEVHNSITPEGKPYTLLNLPYFLTSEIFRYLEWFIKET